MRGLVLGLVTGVGLGLGIGPGVVMAGDWQVLDGAAISRALSARVLQYAGGARQDFKADGRTLYESGGGSSGGGPSWGSWRVEGDRYCSVWPPSDRWACFEVAARGLEIRFREDGADTIGRYVDLN